MFKKLAVFITIIALAIGSTDVFGKGGGYSSGGGHSSGHSSYSSGSSRSSYSSGSSKPSSGYSSGNSKPSSGYSSGSSHSSQPSGSFFSSQTKAQQQSNSRDAFKAATTPAAKVDAIKTSPSFQDSTVKKTITHERYITYEDRSRSFYGGYYGRPMNPSYSVFGGNPCFNMFFWMWLMEKADHNERANWAYNHRSQMSDAEFKALCVKDTNLEARVKELEKKGQAQDPNYVPAAMADNPDLMYNAHFVKAAAEENEGMSGWHLNSSPSS